jgi:tripartite-type tricarboxylate transporter receptor subunit TctC
MTMVVPYSAGGPTDTIARIMAERMRTSLGQIILVENTTGAAGTIGVGRVARAAPDGYTISIGHWGTHVVNGAIYELQYHVFNDFEPVSLIATNPQLIVARKTVPANDLKELIVWLKANAATATQGTAGHGSGSHVSGVYFQSMTDAKFQFVPYRGAGPAMQDLVAGQIDIMIDQAANSIPQVRAGTIKAYAVTAKTRLAAAPDIPTVDEAGVPGLHISIWHALWMPKGTYRQAQWRRCRRLSRCRRAQAARRSRPGNSAARGSKSADARGLPPRRDREVVADPQSREHQGRINPVRRSHFWEATG